MSDWAVAFVAANCRASAMTSPVMTTEEDCSMFNVLGSKLEVLGSTGEECSRFKVLCSTEEECSRLEVVGSRLTEEECSMFGVVGNGSQPFREANGLPPPTPSKGGHVSFFRGGEDCSRFNVLCSTEEDCSRFEVVGNGSQPFREANGLPPPTPSRGGQEKVSW